MRHLHVPWLICPPMMKKVRVVPMRVRVSIEVALELEDPRKGRGRNECQVLSCPYCLKLEIRGGEEGEARPGEEEGAK